MKSLVESIFGGRDSIAKNAKDGILWKGFDDAINNSHNGFWWYPEPGNILEKVCGITDIYYMRIFRPSTEEKNVICVHIRYGCLDSICFVLTGAKASGSKYKILVKEILSIFRNNPEIFELKKWDYQFGRGYVMPWEKFKKIGEK